MWPSYRRLFDRHGIALFLFPPVLDALVEQSNKARGRVSASAKRNCAARVNHVVMALCRWLKYSRFLFLLFCVFPLSSSRILFLFRGSDMIDSLVLVCPSDYAPHWQIGMRRGARHWKEVQKKRAISIDRLPPLQDSLSSRRRRGDASMARMSLPRSAWKVRLLLPCLVLTSRVSMSGRRECPRM